MNSELFPATSSKSSARTLGFYFAADVAAFVNLSRPFVYFLFGKRASLMPAFLQTNK